MEKSKLLKVFLVVVVSIALTLTSVQTFAATNFIDITNESTTDTHTASGDTNTNSNTGSTNTNTNSTSNTNSSANTNANTNRNTLANTSTNRNGSSYNNTNLPSTGLAETGSIVCIIFALVVSAIYAFKKIRDYNNI